jgi:hypothetical protein
MSVMLAILSDMWNKPEGITIAATNPRNAEWWAFIRSIAQFREAPRWIAPRKSPIATSGQRGVALRQGSVEPVTASYNYDRD